jgi:V/A-type H+-transporting ATPase subunit D
VTRLSLNKSTLSKQIKQLKAYQNFLPSLDLKRRQLLAEQNKASEELAEIRQRLNTLEPSIARQIPMLANVQIDLMGLVEVTHVDLVEENVMGTRLPKLNRLEVSVQNYSFLAKPIWVDSLVELLKQALEIRIQIQVAERKVELLNRAARTVTQRVNLFDKVLIPQTKQNIKKIQIYLADAERAGVVQAKLAKAEKRVAS